MSAKERNKPLLEHIIDLKAEHPFWGYRRIWAYLKYWEGLPKFLKKIVFGKSRDFDADYCFFA